MHNKQGLDLLLEPVVKDEAPFFIIYCASNTERLAYTCEFIFSTVLKVKHTITSDLTEFEKSVHFKINYSFEQVPGTVQIMPQRLLTETGISEIKPVPFFKDQMIYFYPAGLTGNNEIFHFDIFSAIFYFISRYEEWQAYEKDKHQRFEAAASILFQNKFHLKPVVDIWIGELRTFLLTRYKNLEFPPQTFSVISTIDVDNLFAYKDKGVLRTFGACLKDVVNFDFSNVKERMKVLSGSSKDPFDIYESVSEFCLELNMPLICFFLLRTGTANDRTVNPRSSAFKKVFDTLKNKKAYIGLHPSYDSAFEKGRLKRECELITEKNGEPVKISRQHFLRFDIRTTPKLLMENGIGMDASMGFASSPGFRAGTSYPFYYFDFSAEKSASLRFLPFCTMDGAYFVYSKTSPDETLESMLDLASEVKKTGGFFITVFHERTFSNHLYPGFGTLYKNLYLRLKQI